MNICLVSSNGPSASGGLPAVTRSVASRLAETSSVGIVARFSSGGPQQLSYSARERPQTLRYDGFDLRVIAPVATMTPLLDVAQRCSHHPVLQPTSRRIFERAYGRGLERAIPREAEVVHFVGAGWEMLGFPALRAARRRGACFTVWPAIHPGVWGDSEVDATLYRAADALFAQSRFERDRLIELGVAPERIILSPCGPVLEQPGDAERFRARYGLGSRPLVLFLGRRQRYKGYHAVVEAMQTVRERVSEACLVAAGQHVEPPYPDLEPGALVDLGRCDDQTKADALAACDVLCLPSTAEAFGIVYVEAWASGKPVIGGSAPAVRELIRDGIDGFCVSQSPAEIAARIELVLTDTTLGQRLGAAGRLRQQAEFTWDRVVGIAQTAFERCWNERQAGQGGGSCGYRDRSGSPRRSG